MRAGSWTSGRSSVGLLCALAVAGSALSAPGTGTAAERPRALPPGGRSTDAHVSATAVSSPVASRPVTPRVREVRLPKVGPAAARRGVVVSSAPEPVTGYGVVGVTWQGRAPEGFVVSIRTRSGERWSPWQRLYQPGCSCADASADHLPGADGHRPDRGSSEAHGVRRGTDPFVVGEVDAVQARAASGAERGPRDLRLSVVDPGRGTLDHAGGRHMSGVAAASAEPAQSAALTPVTYASAALEQYSGPRAPRPRILSRRAWGADPRLRSGSPRYGRVEAGFVHHTVNANGYSRSDVPKIIRGIYAYHTQSLGWSDIGYNFLVDRFGRKWVGRYGGWRRAVIGAHTYGYNHLSTGMAAIGRFQRHRPPRRLVAAMGRMMGWKLGLHGVRAGDRSRWLEGKRFRAVSGHRDAGQTACPGWQLYKRLRAVRRTAIRWQHR